LVDDLRQVFLAALAPDLCNASGSERSAFAALAHAMGLPRVVRSMELLGHAMVDMRDAPDAQVVLEIALVRAARPDLDQGTAGLAERVGVLERIVATGGYGAGQPGDAEEQKSTVPPEAEVGQRPSVGAVRRNKSDKAPSASGAGDSATPEPEGVAAPVRSGSNGGGGGSVSSPDRESFTQAWGDGVLHGLSARAKALYSAGRFVSVDEDGVQFALPNEAHRERCLELVPQVEAALAERFDTKIRLVLVVEGGQGGHTPIPSASTQDSRTAQADNDFEHEDPGEFPVLEAEDPSASAVDRLLQAFPGAEEIVD
jgi:hypothetical protein